MRLNLRSSKRGRERPASGGNQPVEGRGGLAQASAAATTATAPALPAAATDPPTTPAPQAPAVHACITCPRCGMSIGSLALRCPRCLEPLQLGCSGDCRSCGKT